MSDMSALEAQIMMYVEAHGFVRVDSNKELRQELQLEATNREFHSAIGHLIGSGKLVRSRRAAISMTESRGPVTYWPAHTPVPECVLQDRADAGGQLVHR